MLNVCYLVIIFWYFYLWLMPLRWAVVSQRGLLHIAHTAAAFYCCFFSTKNGHMPYAWHHRALIVEDWSMPDDLREDFDSSEVEMCNDNLTLSSKSTFIQKQDRVGAYGSELDAVDGLEILACHNRASALQGTCCSCLLVCSAMLLVVSTLSCRPSLRLEGLIHP